MSARLDELLEQLAEQGDALEAAQAKLADLEAARARVTELRESVGTLLFDIASATGAHFVQTKPAPPPAAPRPSSPVWPAHATPTVASSVALANAPVAAAEDKPSVEPARAGLFGGQQKRLPPTPPPARKPLAALSEGAGDDEEDDDVDDQVDDESEPDGSDDVEEIDVPVKRKAAGGRPTKPGSLNERVCALLHKHGPLTSGDIISLLGEPKSSVTATLSYLAAKGTLTKSSRRGAPYALAKGAK